MNAAGAPPARARVEWRPWTLGLFLGAAALLVAALVVRSPVPLFLALPLLLAPPASALLAPSEAPSARLTWDAALGGRDVRIRGALELEGGLRAEELALAVARPASFGEAAPVETCAEGRRLDFRLLWLAERPTVEKIPVPRVVWRDPLGLVEVPVAVRGDPLYVERFPPELEHVRRIPLRRTMVLPGEFRSRARGEAGEFLGLRPYGPGDAPRQINWRASARTGGLVANEFYPDRTGDLLLLVDRRPSELGREFDQPLLALARAAALALANRFLLEKNRVGLGLYAEFLTAVPLGSGRLQRYRIREALLEASLASVAGPSERFAATLRRYFPPGVTTVLVSSLADEESARLVPHLRRRGFAPFVLSPSPLPLLATARARRGPVDPLADRLLGLVRRLTIQQTWADAPVVDWSQYWSLASFVRLFGSPAARRGRSV